MKKTGVILVVLLIIFSLVGCSGQNPVKTQSTRSPSTPQNISTYQDKQAVASQSNITTKQSNSNNATTRRAASSDQLTEVNATLDSLNDTLKNLDDVTSEDLTLPPS